MMRHFENTALEDLFKLTLKNRGGVNLNPPLLPVFLPKMHLPERG